MGTETETEILEQQWSLSCDLSGEPDWVAAGMKFLGQGHGRRMCHHVPPSFIFSSPSMEIMEPGVASPSKVFAKSDEEVARRSLFSERLGN